MKTDERRKFLLQAGALLGITVCAGSLSSALSSCDFDDSKFTPILFDVDVTTFSKLATTGLGVKMLGNENPSGKPIIIMRTADDVYTVFTAICTHAGCVLDPPETVGLAIVCDFRLNGCGHGAEYNPMTGEQTIGPLDTPPKGKIVTVKSTFNSTSKILTIIFS